MASNYKNFNENYATRGNLYETWYTGVASDVYGLVTSAFRVC